MTDTETDTVRLTFPSYEDARNAAAAMARLGIPEADIEIAGHQRTGDSGVLPAMVAGALCFGLVAGLTGWITGQVLSVRLTAALAALGAGLGFVAAALRARHLSASRAATLRVRVSGPGRAPDRARAAAILERYARP